MANKYMTACNPVYNENPQPNWYHVATNSSTIIHHSLQIICFSPYLNEFPLQIPSGLFPEGFPTWRKLPFGILCLPTCTKTWLGHPNFLAELAIHSSSTFCHPNSKKNLISDPVLNNTLTLASPLRSIGERRAAQSDCSISLSLGLLWRKHDSSIYSNILPVLTKVHRTPISTNQLNQLIVKTGLLRNSCKGSYGQRESRCGYDRDNENQEAAEDLIPDTALSFHPTRLVNG